MLYIYEFWFLHKPVRYILLLPPSTDEEQRHRTVRKLAGDDSYWGQRRYVNISLLDSKYWKWILSYSLTNQRLFPRTTPFLTAVLLTSETPRLEILVSLNINHQAVRKPHNLLSQYTSRIWSFGVCFLFLCRMPGPHTACTTTTSTPSPQPEPALPSAKSTHSCWPNLMKAPHASCSWVCTSFRWGGFTKMYQEP